MVETITTANSAWVKAVRTNEQSAAKYQSAQSTAKRYIISRKIINVPFIFNQHLHRGLDFFVLEAQQQKV